jgi:hypothetical protein
MPLTGIITPIAVIIDLIDTIETAVLDMSGKLSEVNAEAEKVMFAKRQSFGINKCLELLGKVTPVSDGLIKQCNTLLTKLPEVKDALKAEKMSLDEIKSAQDMLERYICEIEKYLGENSVLKTTLTTMPFNAGHVKSDITIIDNNGQLLLEVLEALKKYLAANSEKLNEAIKEAITFVVDFSKTAIGGVVRDIDIRRAIFLIDTCFLTHVIQQRDKAKKSSINFKFPTKAVYVTPLVMVEMKRKDNKGIQRVPDWMIKYLLTINPNLVIPVVKRTPEFVKVIVDAWESLKHKKAQHISTTGEMELLLVALQIPPPTRVIILSNDAEVSHILQILRQKNIVADEIWAVEINDDGVLSRVA